MRIRFILACLSLVLSACAAGSSSRGSDAGQSGIQVYGTVDIGIGVVR